MSGLCFGVSKLSDCVLLEGERDALVTLRSAINEALGQGRAEADLERHDESDLKVVVRRIGA
jgi:hypothetical protein